MQNDSFFDIYRPQTKLREGNVFKPVYDSVHRGVGHVWQGNAWQGGVCGRGGMCAGEMATEAGGTHPTEMHSCFKTMMVQWRVLLESQKGGPAHVKKNNAIESGRTYSLFHVSRPSSTAMECHNR